MEKVKDSYRTKDGKASYAFSLEKQSDSTWRAYIETPPSYGGRLDNAHATHRLIDGERRYVCWSEPVRSPADMKQIAAMWADSTQNYIKTGSFSDPNAN